MKYKILNILKSNIDGYISGEQLSEQLGISRAAIWKHMNALKADGYVIDAITNKGYRLMEETDAINASWLSAYAEPYTFLEFAKFYEAIDSTNSEAKRLALENPNWQGVLISDFQTGGKGRMGRYWASEKGKGLWMSLLLRPDIPTESASSITMVAAAAMCQAIEAVSGASVGIKWPNDLIVNGKKVCGILTEMGAELSMLHYIVLGIGVNIGQVHFEKELEDKATSLFLEGFEVSKKKLLIAFLNAFENVYMAFLNNDIEHVIQYHREKSKTLNHFVILNGSNGQRQVFAKDLDAKGCLLIINEENQPERICSGEVSVRGINGYV